MPENRGSKQEFLKTFPWPKNVEWLGEDLFVKLSGGRLAKIELTIRAGHGMPTQGHWDGFEVHVLDTSKGEINNKFFNWNDHLKLAPKQRHPGANPKEGLCILDYCGWHWYINQPASVTPIVEDIGKYLKFFDSNLGWVVREG